MGYNAHLLNPSIKADGIPIPQGHYNLSPDSTITINSSLTCVDSVTVTIIYGNLLKYESNHVYTLESEPVQVQEEIQPEPVQEESEPVSELEPNEVFPSIPYFSVPSVSRNIGYYIPLLERYHMDSALYRPTLEKCVISLEKIGIFEYYYKCPQCQAITSKKNMDEWLLNNTTCPVCRYDNLIIPNLYKNSIDNRILLVGLTYLLTIWMLIRPT